ncbi:MAG: hypothetical protein IPG93_08755 [Burkholderiales bacterium]|nr:hypothetical protein [Burkholderiales bacterium]
MTQEAVIDIAINLSGLCLTDANHPTNFIMEASAITVTTTTSPQPEWLTIGDVSEDWSLGLNVSKVNQTDQTITLIFHVHDAAFAWPGNPYGIQGIIYKLNAQSAAGTPATMPTRFGNIRGVGTEVLEVDYDLSTSGLIYEYYLVVQNRVSGAWGIIDPRISTRP